jgi:hypothetical protein
LTETKAVLPTPPTPPTACKLLGESSAELTECLARQQRYNEEATAYSIARPKAELAAHTKYEEELHARCRAQWDTPGPLCGATATVQLEPYVQVRLSRPNAILGGEDWECDRS